VIKRLALLLVLSVVSSTSGFSQVGTGDRWVYQGVSKEGNAAFLDTLSIDHLGGDSVRFTDEVFYMKEKQRSVLAGKTIEFDRMITTHIGYCRARETALRSVTYLLIDKVVESRTISSPMRVPALPASLGETELAVACQWKAGGRRP
jgi:hypothetical protein